MAQAFDIVTIARKTTRPTALDFINKIFRDFIELHGDRLFKDDTSVVGGVARLSGRSVTVIGIQKGHTVEENIYRNFGSVHPEGYRKALRLMKQAEKFNRPIITLVNTPGAFCGIGAEERGQGEAIARNLYEMSGIRVPIISVIIGEGGSGGALALAVADQVWMLKNAVYSILSPEGFASILWKDSTKAKEAADLMKLTSKDLLELKVIDKIIEEHKDGCENDFDLTAKILKKELKEALISLEQKDVLQLLQERYERFRAFGSFIE